MSEAVSAQVEGVPREKMRAVARMIICGGNMRYQSTCGISEACLRIVIRTDEQHFHLSV